MTGCRNRTNGLWCVDLSAQSPPTTLNNKANYIVTKTNAEKITRFLHGACGSPTIETFAKAIEAGFLATWPGALSRNTRQYLRAPTATMLGHLDHQRKNKLSSKKIH